MLTYKDIFDLIETENKKIKKRLDELLQSPNSKALHAALTMLPFEYQILDHLLTRITLQSDLPSSTVVNQEHAHVLKEMIEASKKHPNSRYNSDPALIELAKQVDKLVEENPQLNRDNLDLMSQFVIACADNELLDDDVSLAVVEHELSIECFDSLVIFEEEELLDRESALFVLKHAHPSELYACLKFMTRRNIFHPQTFSLLAPGCVVAFNEAIKINVITTDMINLLSDEETNKKTADTLALLFEYGVDCRAYPLLSLLRLAKPLELVAAIIALNNAGELSVELFESLVANFHVFDLAHVPAWGWLTGEQYTAELVLHALHIATVANGDRDLAQNHMQFALEEIVPPENHPDIPLPAQTTHTASIHKAASESAKRLWAIYHRKVDSDEKLQTIFNRIHAWLHRLPVTDDPRDKVVAARKALVTLRKCSHVDPVSKVSNQQFLAMFWLALQEPKYKASVYRTNNYDRAAYNQGVYQPLLEALYECQRGYNIEKKGKEEIDDGMEDRPICPGGCFNKKYEKMVGVHSAVIFCSITHEHVQGRLTEEIEKAVKHYLQHASHIELRHLIKLVDETKIDADMDPTECDQELWNGIKDDIREKMVKENFEAAYESQQRFEQVVANGLFVINALKSAELLRPYREVVKSSALQELSVFAEQPEQVVKSTPKANDDKENKSQLGSSL